MKIIDDPSGGPAVIVNTHGAVIPQHAEVALLAYAGDQDASIVIGLELEGPRTDDDLASRSDELYLLDVDMAARLIALLIGLMAQHAAADVKTAFFDGLDARLDSLRTKDGGPE